MAKIFELMAGLMPAPNGNKPVVRSPGSRISELGLALHDMFGFNRKERKEHREKAYQQKQTKLAKEPGFKLCSLL